MAKFDQFAGILQGLTSGLDSYMQTSERNKDRAFQEARYADEKALREAEVKANEEKRKAEREWDKQKLKVDARGKGLLIDFDETGNIVDKGYDPEYLQMQKDKLATDPFGNKALAAQSARLNIQDKMQGTGDERKAAGYAARLQQSENVFSDLANRGYNRADIKESARRLIGNVIPGAKTSEYGQNEQAERNFVNSILRRESGAAISPTEFESAEKQYFPRPGDTPAVIEQKRQNRLQAIANLENEAGVAFQPQGLIQRKQAQQTSKAPKAGSVEGGYMFKGGNPADPKNWERINR